MTGTAVAEIAVAGVSNGSMGSPSCSTRSS